MYALRRFSNLLRDERFTNKRQNKRQQQTLQDAVRQNEAKRKQAPQSEANVCRRRRQMQSRKNLPY